MSRPAPVSRPPHTDGRRRGALALTAAMLALPGVAAGQPAIAPLTAGDAAPAAPAEPAAPATAPAAPVRPGVEVEVVSTEGRQWEVMVDHQSTCNTPCRLMLDGPRWITLRSLERNPLRLEVGELGHRPARLSAKPLGTGKWATGISFTAIGGTAAVTGVVLTAVGCSTDRDGMCTAGLITGGAGLAVTGLGIWLIRRGLPRTWVRDLDRRQLGLYATGRGAGLAGHF